MKSLLILLSYVFLSSIVFGKEIDSKGCLELYSSWSYDKLVKQVCDSNDFPVLKKDIIAMSCKDRLDSFVIRKVDEEILSELEESYEKIGLEKFCKKEGLKDKEVTDSFLEQVLQFSNKGDAKSQVVLGSMYLVGDGVEKSKEKALFWLEKSAQQNFTEAKVLLADIYSESEETKKECYKNYLSVADDRYENKKYAEALEYYEKSFDCARSKEHKVVSLASLASVEYSIGNIISSKKYIKEILSMSPNNPWVQEFMKNNGINYKELHLTNNNAEPKEKTNKDICINLYKAWVLSEGLLSVCNHSPISSSELGLVAKENCNNVLSEDTTQELAKPILIKLREDYQQLGEDVFCKRARSSWWLYVVKGRL